MLETQGLLLSSWLPEKRAERRRWFARKEHHDRKHVRDLATESYLGFARRRWMIASGWLPWPGWPVIEVFETDDVSLLLTSFCRSWSRTWEVVDSENKLIGCIRPQLAHFPHVYGETNASRGLHLEDANRRAVAWLPIPRADEKGEIHGPTGQELGFWAHTEQGTELRFAGSIQGDPFAKMLILAACLNSKF